jgi:tetratricopeptide (TPR) repeat protein
MQEDYLLAKECLEKTLKMAEECRWSYLYVKGVVEMALENYYTAVKEFSAGLILEVRPELYLGRSISFFMLS